MTRSKGNVYCVEIWYPEVYNGWNNTISLQWLTISFDQWLDGVSLLSLGW